MTSASSEPTMRPSPSSSGASGGAVTTTGHAGGAEALSTSQGRTTVADTVVQKIAGRATREVSGVHDFGGGAARAFGSITERIPGARASSGRGVSVEVGEKQAAIDLDIVIEYGAAIGPLAQAIRRNVIGSVEQMTGLEVVEVNINVNDLHLPEDDGGGGGGDDRSPEPPRVR